ncbi:MAG: 3-phosphoshikimate 1-carboxyvinyltransferase, partial [Candidatus Margulisiibacteriota bacterium]
MQSIIVKPTSSLIGTMTVPGDKSLSHRALLIGALADGVVTITGFLHGEDPQATLNCLRELGVGITIEQGYGENGGGAVVVNGVGGKLRKPPKP